MDRDQFRFKKGNKTKVGFREVAIH